MSALYLVPSEGESSEIQDHLKRAGIPFYTPQTVREMILATEQDEFAVCTVSVSDLMTIGSNVKTLMKDLPTCIHGAPGFAYMGDWVTASTRLPAMDWKEMVEKTKKSGATGYTAEDVEKRDQNPTGPSLRSLATARQAGTSSNLGSIADDADQDDSVVSAQDLD
nr:MAG: hypothetical protein [Jiangsu sediment cysto-like virus 7]QYF49778.1 MAG: hypothetical protein [Jiangsu sediment cysto-like virus 8]